MRQRILVLALWFCGMLSAQIPSYPLDTIDGKVFFRYEVEKSIGLYRIGVNFHVTQDEILKYNPDIVDRGLRYGETILHIPVNEEWLKELQASAPIVADTMQVAVNEEAMPAMDSIVMPSVMPDSLSTDTISHDTVMVPQAGSKHLALLLPLQAKALDRDESMDRFMEFYNGVLLGLKHIQRPDREIILDVYDTDKSMYTLRKLLANGILEQVDYLLGPAYPQQVMLVGDSAAAHQIPVIIPFIDNVVGIESNPMLWQFNASDARRAHAIVSYLESMRDTMNCVLVDAKKSDIPRSIRVLRDSIEAHALPCTKTTIHDILNDSLASALVDNKINYLLFNTERYPNLSVLMPKVKEAILGHDVVLISQYSWQDEAIRMPQIYPSVFTAPVDSTLSSLQDSLRAAYEQDYTHFFGSKHVSEHPRYDLLGYDLIRSLEGIWENKESIGLQSKIVFEQQDSIGGYQNTHIEIITRHE